jgi:hypothetical protein
LFLLKGQANRDRLLEWIIMTAQEALDRQFLEMRWRCLSLAADFDRIERLPGGVQLLQSDPRLQILRQALQVLQQPGPNRAEQVQLLFSDHTPPPTR